MGRDEELASLAAAADVVASGSSATVLIRGDPGIGKSVVLEQSVDAAKPRLRILRGECVRIEMKRAFGPFIDAFFRIREPSAAVRAALALPEERQSNEFTATGDVYRVHAAFSRAIVELARERPTMIAIDDLHWADEASLELFASLGRKRIRGLLLVATTRTEEAAARGTVRRALADLPPDHIGLTLRPLTALEVARILRLILGRGATTEQMTALLHSRSAGNPLLLEEILRALARRGEITEQEGLWRLTETTSIPLPATVKEAVRERLLALPADITRVIETAAVIGERFAFQLLVSASERDESVVVAALRSASDALLIQELDADHFTFRHTLVRDAVVDNMLLRERHATHRRVGEILAALRDDELIPDLAYHFDAAGESALALEYHRKAGERDQRRGASADALMHYERARALVDDHDDRAVAWLEGRIGECASVLEQQTRGYRAVAAANERYQRIGDGLMIARTYLAMRAFGKRLLLRSDELETLRTKARTVLDSLGESPELAWLLTIGAREEAVEGRFDRALVEAQNATALYERNLAKWGPTWIYANALDALGQLQLLTGDGTNAIETLRRAVAVAEEDPRLRLDVLALGSLVFALRRLVGETDETRALGAKRSRLLESYGSASGASDRIARLHRLFMLPDWDAFIALQEDVGYDNLETFESCHISVHRALVDIARDGTDAAPALAAAHARFVDAGSVVEQSTASVAQAWLIAGDPLRALRSVEPALATNMPNVYRPAFTTAAIYGILAANAAGDTAVRDSWLRRVRLDDVSPIVDDASLRDTRAFVRCEQDHASADGEAAIVALRDVIRIRRERPPATPDSDPVLTHHLELRLIEMLIERAGVGDRDEAQRSLDRTFGFWRDARAVWYCDQLAARAAAWGLEVSATPRREAGQPLTPREREIAELVADGLTNREIASRLSLSVRTAESHVANIRTKLGLRSRAQLASWATETYGRG